MAGSITLNLNRNPETALLESNPLVNPGPQLVLIGHAQWVEGSIQVVDSTPGATWTVYTGGTSASTIQVIGNVFRVENPNAIPQNDVVVTFTHASMVNEVFVEMKWRLPVAGSSRGCKLFKIHGQMTSGNYANITYGMDYEDAGLTRISNGDGSITENDSQNILLFDGTNKNLAGRNFTAPGAILSTPQNSAITRSALGTGWHISEYETKFNSGTSALNEINNGVMKYVLDGVVYAHAQNIFNRHYSNLPIDRLSFIDVAQAAGAGYTLDIEYIKVFVRAP